jgi:hypothetical protein
LLPFYGDTSGDPRQFDRSQAKRGTCSFYAYASVYIIHKGHRSTVGLMAVPSNVSNISSSLCAANPDEKISWDRTLPVVIRKSPWL